MLYSSAADGDNRQRPSPGIIRTFGIVNGAFPPFAIEGCSDQVPTSGLRREQRLPPSLEHDSRVLSVVGHLFGIFCVASFWPSHAGPLPFWDTYSAGLVRVTPCDRCGCACSHLSVVVCILVP